jgi:hypothetical protein
MTDITHHQSLVGDSPGERTNEVLTEHASKAAARPGNDSSLSFHQVSAELDDDRIASWARAGDVTLDDDRALLADAAGGLVALCWRTDVMRRIQCEDVDAGVGERSRSLDAELMERLALEPDCCTERLRGVTAMTSRQLGSRLFGDIGLRLELQAGDRFLVAVTRALEHDDVGVLHEQLAGAVAGMERPLEFGCTAISARSWLVDDELGDHLAQGLAVVDHLAVLADVTSVRRSLEVLALAGSKDPVRYPHRRWAAAVDAGRRRGGDARRWEVIDTIPWTLNSVEAREFGDDVHFWDDLSSGRCRGGAIPDEVLEVLVGRRW